MADALPPSIRVGYRTYAIEIMSAMHSTSRDVFGECDNCVGIIRIRADLDRVKAVNTMLHEIMHACFYVAGLQDEDKQERTVTGLANQVTQVWRDNPALIDWIAGGLS